MSLRADDASVQVEGADEAAAIVAHRSADGARMEGAMLGRAAWKRPWDVLSDADRHVFGAASNPAVSRRQVCHETLDYHSSNSMLAGTGVVLPMIGHVEPHSAAYIKGHAAGHAVIAHEMTRLLVSDCLRPKAEISSSCSPAGAQGLRGVRGSAAGAVAAARRRVAVAERAVHDDAAAAAVPRRAGRQAVEERCRRVAADGDIRGPGVPADRG